MKKTQPDFTKLFFDSLGGSPEKIFYTLRRGPNLLHDLAFLSSLLHDARVLTPHAQNNGTSFEILLNRDCWELGTKSNPLGDELHVANCIVRFTGVRSVQWRFTKGEVVEPWLDYCWIDRAWREPDAREFQFLLVGTDWRCEVNLDHDNWSVEMADQETPHTCK